MEKLYKVIVFGGLNSGPLSYEEALEYAAECNVGEDNYKIVELITPQ
jgi:hypothetical protein